MICEELFGSTSEEEENIGAAVLNAVLKVMIFENHVISSVI
jgi:hypothetical protein